MIQKGDYLPNNCVFPMRDVNHTAGFRYNNTMSEELFRDKRVLIFGLPGAFTPTCSKSQLPAYERRYDEFRSHGIDDIYCCAVNDTFVMEAWRKTKGIKNVTMLPDGSGIFTQQIGALVSKDNMGFGQRSWRYALLVHDMKVEAVFVEEGMEDNAEKDPYEISHPSNVMKYLRGIA